MNNIFIGSNACVAKKTISFSDAGITSDNTQIIFCIEGVSLSSFKPGRGINAITGFELGKGYYFIAKQNLDQTENLIPPIPEGGTGDLSNVLLTGDGAPVNTGGGTGGIFSSEFSNTFN